MWGSEEKPLIVRGDVTGKSYKLEFKISYDDGEKSYETDKYVFVKTTAKKSHRKIRVEMQTAER